jgi:UDP-N-acetylglucosamine 1-carboxyvinyltransferase
MTRIKIYGGRPISGNYFPSGNKNSALPIIAASLLLKGNCKISNVPRTKDIEVFVESLKNIGFPIQFSENVIEYSSNYSEINPIIGNPLLLPAQVAFLIIPSLLKNNGKVSIQGLNFAQERISTHINVFEQFKINVEISSDKLDITQTNSIIGQSIILNEASVTATEIAIMLSIYAKGKSKIYNAACEPHVQELIRYLNLSGAKIVGGGTNLIEVVGVDEIRCTDFSIGYDHIEIASLILLAAMTKGELKIMNTDIDTLKPILPTFKKFGINIDFHENYLVVPIHEQLKVPDMIKNFERQITVASAPWPGFPSDLMPLLTVVATQTEGTFLINEKMYNTRMHFIDYLVSMGAQIVQCDPNRVVVVGPTKLIPTYLETPDMRTGLALLGAALVTNGKCIIDDAQMINRVFENTVKKLQTIGVSIEVE